MTRNRDASELTPLLRLGLKRVKLEEHVFGDEHLAHSEFVRRVGESGVRAILADAVGRRFPDQTQLFAQGEPGETLVFILKGEVRLQSDRGPASVELGIARKGEVLGEGEFLGYSRIRSYCAQASGEVEAIELSHARIGLAGGCGLLRAHLEKLHRERKSAGADLADFLNRW